MTYVVPYDYVNELPGLQKGVSLICYSCVNYSVKVAWINTLLTKQVQCSRHSHVENTETLIKTHTLKWK